MQLRTAFSVLSLALISRLLVFAFGLLAVVSVGFENGQRPTPPLSDSALLDLPARWDSGWYVGLASGHYRWDGQAGRFENVAFFPAYPAIVSAVANTLGAESPLAWDWVAVGTSTTLFAVSLVLLTALATRIVGADSASHSALLCACYPFSIFFGLPYSESTYLCAVVAAFLMLEQRAYAACLAAGVVAGLARPTSITLFPALFTTALLYYRSSGFVGRWHHSMLGLAASIGPLLGIGVFSMFIYGLTGSPFTWATVQEGWGRPTGNPLTALLQPLLDFAAAPLSTLLTRPHDILNATAGLGIIASLPLVWRTVGSGYALFVLGGVLMPLTGGGLASLGRYTSVLFPVFIALAVSLSTTNVRRVAVVFLLLQAVVAGLFFTWRPMY
jgi:hypothetical protein